MRRKRLLNSLVFLVAMALLLSACSGGNTSSGTSNAGTVGNSSGTGNTNGANADAKEAVNLSVWLTPQWKGVFDANEEGADYDSFFRYAAEKFISEYDKYDVTINVEVIAGDQRDQMLNVMLTGGTPPDVFFESIFAMSDYVHRGALVPLTDIVDDAAKADIAENYWEVVKFGEDYYFYPFQHNPGTLVYNADMFRAAGLDPYIGSETEIKTWTLQEFETILQGLKENLPKDKYPNAYAFGLFALNNQADTWNLAYLRMFGNPFFDENSRIILADENGFKAARWLKQIYDAGYTNPGPESVSSNDVNAMFQNQQIAISFTNSILYNNLKADMANGKLTPFDARLANIPSESGDPLTFTYVVGGAVFDTGDPRRIEAAKDFVKFFSTDEELVLASKNGVPVRTSVANKFKDDHPLFAAYDANSKYLFNFTGNVPGYSQLREQLYPELQAMYMGAKTPEQAIEDYQENGNRVIDQNRATSVIYQSN